MASFIQMSQINSYKFSMLGSIADVTWIKWTVDVALWLFSTIQVA